MSFADEHPALVFDEQAIDAILAPLDQCALPGAAVGIAIQGVPAYRRGVGLASMELPVVLSPAMRMRIGSVSKHFTALAYLLLCDEGRASLDDSPALHLPELHRVAHGVTMRQLMGHVSGLRDAYNICMNFGGAQQRVSTEDVVALYRDIDDVNTPPATTWIYNNGGYQILSLAIERIADRPLEEVLVDRIFRPAGLLDTLLRRWDTGFMPNSATLHMTGPDGSFEKSDFKIALAGEGGIVATVDDLLRWLAQLGSPSIAPAGAWDVLRTPQILRNGTATGYGLGLRSSPYRGVDTLWHAGGVMGGNSCMVKVPSVGLDVVVMVNRHDLSAMSLTESILDACLTHSAAPEEDSEGSFFTGVFHSARTGRCIQLFVRERRQIVSIDGTDHPMVADAHGVLRHARPKSHLRQYIERIGPASIRFCDYGNMNELMAAPPSEQGEAIAGRYRSPAVSIDAMISQDGWLTAVSRFGTMTCKLEALARGLYRARSTTSLQLGGILSFDADGRGFHYSSERTRALPFGRVA